MQAHNAPTRPELATGIGPLPPPKTPGRPSIAAPGAKKRIPRLRPTSDQASPPLGSTIVGGGAAIIADGTKQGPKAAHRG